MKKEQNVKVFCRDYSESMAYFNAIKLFNENYPNIKIGGYKSNRVIRSIFGTVQKCYEVIVFGSEEDPNKKDYSKLYDYFLSSQFLLISDSFINDRDYYDIDQVFHITDNKTKIRSKIIRKNRFKNIFKEEADIIFDFENDKLKSFSLYYPEQSLPDIYYDIEEIKQADGLLSSRILEIFKKMILK